MSFFRKSRFAELSLMMKHGHGNSWLTTYLAHHVNAMLISLDRLVSTPLSSLLTIIVIAIALSFPFGMEVLLGNANELNQNLGTGTKISLYLKSDATQAETQAALHKLQNDFRVLNVLYISPREGLEELKKSVDLSDILQDLKQNPLPGVIVVTPKPKFISPLGLNNLLNDARRLSAVEAARLDKVWVKRLHYIIDFGRRSVLMLLTLFGLGVVFIVGNTIRLAMQSARKEISVFKLIGATDAFVRRPFLYTGVYYGVMGGALAWVIITGVLIWLNVPVQNLAESYSSNFSLQGLDLSMTAILLGIGAGLGWIGARLAVGKHVKKN